jgi:hypothetical protein
MKRKQRNELNNIPTKILPKLNVSFNLDDYINEHVNAFIETFTKKCKKEFMLLDHLTNGFLDHLKNDSTLPFEYSTIGSPYQLSEVQQKAIDIFKSKIEPKGYVVSISEKDTCRSWTKYSIIVT